MSDISVRVPTKDFTASGSGGITRDDGYWGGVTLTPSLGVTFIEWKVRLPVAGRWNLHALMTAESSRPQKLVINGVKQPGTILGEVTGSWHANNLKWFVYGPYDFKAGENVVRIEVIDVIPHLREFGFSLVESQAVSSNDLNERIRALAYDPKSVMAFHGTTISNAGLPVEDTYDGSTYIVVTRQKRVYGAEQFDIAVPESYNDVTYPGALLVASDALLDGRPQELSARKAETTMTVSLPGEDMSFKLVPSFGAVQEAIHGKLEAWFAKHGGAWNVPANFSFTSSLVYDEKDLALRFGCDVGFLMQKLGIDFSTAGKTKRSIYIACYKQIFYTVSAERPVEPAGVFAEGTRWADLQRAGVSDAHPPLFVKSVTYGRQIYLKFESSLSSTELETTVKGIFGAKGFGVEIHNSTESKANLERIDVSMVALGGSPAAFSGVRLSDLEGVKKINDVIWQNMVLSPKNPAAPLNYHTVFLKDGVSARVSGKTEYVHEEAVRYEGGQIRLKHDGAYVAQFGVSWDEVSCKDGVMSIRRVQWDESWRDRTAGYSAIISLKGNARNIYVSARGCTGLAWEWWRTSFERHGLPLVPQREVVIWGTTLNQCSGMTPQG